MATRRNPNKKRCWAKSKQSGEQCKRWAVPGFNVCYYHGAGGATPEAEAKERRTLIPGGPPGTPPPPRPPLGHQRARKHGAYTSKLLPEEQAEHSRLVEKFTRGLGQLDDFDEELVDVLALCLTKVRSCAAAGAPADAVMPWAKMVLEHMRELKATRASKDDAGGMGNSPAEVVAMMLARVRTVEEPKPVNVLPRPVQTIEAEVSEVEPDGTRDHGEEE